MDPRFAALLMSLATVALVSVIAILMTGSIVKIHQAEVMIIERLGKYHKTLRPGLRFYVPFLDSPRSIVNRYREHDPSGKIVYREEKRLRIDMRETPYDFDWQEVITKDNVILKINALLFYQIVDPIKVAYEVNNFIFGIEELTRAALRNLVGEMTLDQTLSSRTIINEQLKAKLTTTVQNWGVTITRIELQEVDPPQSAREAMEQLIRAERSSRAAVIEAEALKKGQILKSEGEAISVENLTQSLRNSSVDPTQYLIALRYLEALKEMVSGKDNKVVYLPIEASSVLGSLGGIKEIFRDMNP